MALCDEQVEHLQDLERRHFDGAAADFDSIGDESRDLSVFLVWALHQRTGAATSSFHRAALVLDVIRSREPPVTARDTVLRASAVWLLVAQFETSFPCNVAHGVANELLAEMGSSSLTSQELAKEQSRILLDFGSSLWLGTAQSWLHILCRRFDDVISARFHAAPDPSSPAGRTFDAAGESALLKCVFRLPATAELPPRTQAIACFASALVMAEVLPTPVLAMSPAEDLSRFSVLWSPVASGAAFAHRDRPREFKRSMAGATDLPKSDARPLPPDSAVAALEYATSANVQDIRRMVADVLAAMQRSESDQSTGPAG